MKMLISVWISLCLWLEEARRIPVGGQAVIEGVLMKGPEHWGLVVRTPEGGLWKKSWLGSTWNKKGIWKYPLFRGVASMVEMMRVGMRALNLSAEVALGEDEQIKPWEFALSIAVAMLAVVGLFIALPVWLSDLGVKYWGLGHVGKNVLEGLLRAVIFVLYVASVGLMKDIQRVFAYHGAEHKTINAYEHEAPLTVVSVATFSRIHRRCGTSFLLVVVVISIVIFSFVGDGSLLQRAAWRVGLLPVVIGLGYEFIRAASNSEGICKWLIYPALSLQYLTTREPDDSMIEVAIESLDLALNPETENSRVV